MGEDEYEIEDDGEPEEGYGEFGFPPRPTVVADLKPNKGNKWFVLGAILQFIEGVAEAAVNLFNLLKGGAFERYAWQVERQTFFEQAGPQIERLTALERAEVEDGSTY